MAKDDWAIVVGIQSYPELDPLKGPENDAKAFHDWVTSPGGGDVPKDQAALVISSAYNPPFQSAIKARPIVNDVQAEFEKLQDQADLNERNEEGLRVGRRLYIYFAGHGFAPRDDQTALLMANATKVRAGSAYHVLGQYSADWFFKAAYFDEIMLFMDCCREVYPVPSLNMSFRDANASNAVDTVKRFYGFGTKWSRLSREREMEGGVVRGVFTTALLKGLEGDAGDPLRGEITAASLSSYLYNNMKIFLRPEDLDNPDVPREPEVDYYPRNGDGFVIKKVLVPEFPVTLRLPAGSQGKQVEILSGTDFEVIKSAIVDAPVWQTTLKRGKYLAEILADGRRKIIVVDGTGGVDVSF